MARFVAADEEQMLAVGRTLAGFFREGDCVLLVGAMGAGKTTLAKGIVEGFGGGPADSVSSPTFALVHEYRGERTVYHTDLYRLESPSAVLAIGIEELLDSGCLLLVEWGERYPSLWPAESRVVRILEHGEGREVLLEDGA